MVILSDYQPATGSQGISWYDGIGNWPCCESLLGCDGLGDEVMTKVALAANGELQRWLHTCPVHEKLYPPAKNKPHPRESPEFH